MANETHEDTQIIITKIKTVQNFGLFKDSEKWTKNEFEKYNLIYGWNRSGKTTLSRIFSSIENGEVFFKVVGGKFTVAKSDGKDLNSNDMPLSDDGKPVLAIKVFNSDFVKNKLAFEEPKKNCEPIVTIGKVDLATKQELKDLTDKTKGLKDTHDTAKKNLKSCETALDNFHISTAKRIKDVPNLDPTYNKTKVEKKIAKLGIAGFSGKVLNDKVRGSCEKQINTTAMEKLDPLDLYKISLLQEAETEQKAEEKKPKPTLKNVYEHLKYVLEFNVKSEAIPRLEKDPDLNTWVKQGYDRCVSEHSETCPFCVRKFEDGFFASLEKHYHDSYNKLAEAIESLKTELASNEPALVALKLAELSEAAFHPDYQDGFKGAKENLEGVTNKINQWLSDCLTRLQEREKSMFTPISIGELADKPEDLQTEYNEIIGKINGFVKKHNEKSKNHKEEVTASKTALELHFIASEIEEQNYKTLTENKTTANTEHDAATTAFDTNANDIKALEKKISNKEDAVVEINKHLVSFFGSNEIQLEYDKEELAYQIKRLGGQGSNLSEGEKNAIAFAYFITTLNSKDFELSKGIIFIDDPVSSFDSHYIYNCYAIIKNTFSEAAQLFISTHNFELFNLIRDWFDVNDDDKKKEDCQFFMIENELEKNNLEKGKLDENKRFAYLADLHETLRKFKSEYHYLFSLLLDFTKTVPQNYNKIYVIGNLARKFLEVFMALKIPSSQGLGKKLGTVKSAAEHSELPIDRVLKLINEDSHLKKPTAALEPKSIADHQAVIEDLFTIVETLDQKHFSTLKDELQKCEQAAADQAKKNEANSPK